MSQVIQYREYQVQAVRSLWTYFQSNKGNPIVALPTGSGKSVVIAMFILSAFQAWAGHRVLLLSHVKEILEQDYKKLKQVWPQAPVGIYSDGLGSKDLSRPITVAGIASIAKAWALLGRIDLIIVDECHLISPTEDTMYRALISNLLAKNPALKVIGFTATPFRLGQGMLTDVHVNKKTQKETPPLFTDVCFDMTTEAAFNWMLNEGYLVPLIPKGTKMQFDETGLHTRGGEYVEKEVQALVDQDHLTWAALTEVVEYCQDRKRWLIFAAGIEHAENVGKALTRMGISNGVVHSKGENRDNILTDSKAGRIRAVVNNNVLTTGYDDPEIDLIVYLRLTQSPVLWGQSLGRGTRPHYAPGYDLNTREGRLNAIYASGRHNCLVMDFAGNTKRLGQINNLRVPNPKNGKPGPAPVKQCPVCDTWVPASLRICNGLKWNNKVCGEEFKFERKLKEGASTLELISGELPVMDVVKVDLITVAKHHKVGVPDMARVTYYCGLSKFSTIVCFEHTNYGGRVARQWWKAHTSEPFPESTDAGIEAIGSWLPKATHLRVWSNKKPYPEILAYCLDGTGFGAHAPDTDEVVVQGETSHSRGVQDIIDDDIPF